MNGRIVALTRDLLDAERIRAAAPGAIVVRDPADPRLAGAALIVVDLARPIDLEALAALGPPVVAYGAHVDEEALAAARAAGCEEAVARSRIFRRLRELVE